MVSILLSMFSLRSVSNVLHQSWQFNQPGFEGHEQRPSHTGKSTHCESAVLTTLMRIQKRCAVKQPMCHPVATFLLQDEYAVESAAQNVLAIVLTAILVVALGTVLWKLVAVCWALTAAAFRYSLVALVLVVLGVFLG